jgi:hypothetical protein
MKKGTIILIIFAIASVILVSGCTSESGTITTDILDTQNCTLNASLFENADNTEKDFVVEDPASDISIRFGKDTDPGVYTRIISNINKGTVSGKKTTIANITGYIVEDGFTIRDDVYTGLQFYFVKDGITYVITGYDHDWIESKEIIEVELGNPEGLRIQKAFTDIIEQWNK